MLMRRTAEAEDSGRREKFDIRKNADESENRERERREEVSFEVSVQAEKTAEEDA